RGAREAELEEDLAHARRLTEDAHAAEAQARRELERVKGAESQLRGELDRAQGRIRELTDHAPPVAAPTPPAADVQPLHEQLEAASPEAIEAGEPIGGEEAEGVATPASGTPVPAMHRRTENGIEKKPV